MNLRRISFQLLAALLLVGSLHATTHTVPGSFSTIQSALWACADGDTVSVAPGTYFEPLSWPDTQSIKLFAQSDTSDTFIDGLDTFRPLLFEGLGATDVDTTTIVRGFQITHGGGVVNGGGLLIQSGSSPLFEDCAFSFNECSDTGGAVRCESASAPVFRRCDFRDNHGDFGGGVGHNGASPVFEQCRFLRNTANRSGGASNNFNFTDAVYTECHFEDNHAYTTEGTAASGGALRTSSTSTVLIQGCTFVDNSALFTLPEGDDGYGGAISNNSSSTITVVDCVFENNITGLLGGGIFSFEAEMSLEGCTFTGNSAGRGGGVFLNTAPPTVIRDCTFEENGAIYGAGLAGNADSLHVYNSHFLGNVGYDWSAIDVGFETRFHNCVIAGNQSTGEDTGGHNAIIGFYSGRMELHNCTIVNNATTEMPDTTNSILHYEGELIAGDALLVANCIIAENSAQMVYDCNGLTDNTVECSDIFNSSGPAWTGCLAEFEGANGNFSQDPGFNDPANGDWSLSDESPCQPENNSCNELIGALGEGGTSVGPRGLPASIELSAAPNPFNPETLIRYTLQRASEVELAVYNMAGQRVALIEQGQREAGSHSVRFAASGLASGVYLCRLDWNGGSGTVKLVLLK